MESDAAERLTIDELARRTGMTVRNIRAHQARGLLSPPELRGRTGYYGPEHVERITLIQELQQQGFNLEGIRRLVENSPGASEDILGFTRALREPFTGERPRETTFDELLSRWGPEADLALLRRAADLGFVRSLGGSALEERSPSLSDAALELARLGVPMQRALDVAETMRHHADGVAKAYVELFVEAVWNPFVEAGRPAERWPEVREALERLRPLAAQSLLAVFQLVIAERIEAELAVEVERLAGDAPDERAAS
jgi:DNA-binding transcriptional MerR regulator